MPVKYELHRPHQLPGRAEKRIIRGPQPTIEQPAITFTSWGETQRILDLTFKNDTLTHRAITKHWKLLREYYEALLQIAKTKHDEIIPEEENKMLKFNAEYRNPDSKSHRPRLMNLLEPALMAEEDRFPQLRAEE
jgi:hypothetical protein